MPQFSPERIRKMVSSMRVAVRQLSDLSGLEEKNFLDDSHKIASAKYNFIIAIEAAIDMGNHIISQNSFREPQSYRDVFKVLTENGILSEDDLPKYEKIASFRNILVHHYEKIDDFIVYGVFRNRLEGIEVYVAYILSWLEKRVSKWAVIVLVKVRLI